LGACSSAQKNCVIEDLPKALEVIEELNKELANVKELYQNQVEYIKKRKSTKIILSGTTNHE
jgi:hypothetical protein